VHPEEFSGEDFSDEEYSDEELSEAKNYPKRRIILSEE
jgi:hypothetical protein